MSKPETLLKLTWVVRSRLCIAPSTQFPLAAASLGQVHRAQLHTGEEVVVKVQRPGLKSLFTIDLSILKGIAQYFQNHPTWGRGRDWIGIYEECCRILWQEIDYLNEGRNADTFRRNFRSEDWGKRASGVTGAIPPRGYSLWNTCPALKSATTRP